MKWKRILVILLVILLCIPSNVSAKESEDYKKFTQGGSKWGSDQLGSGSSTIAGAGCAITSITVLMAYANPKMRDSSKWNPGVANKKFNFSGSSIYWGSTTNADSTFTHTSKTPSDTKEETFKKLLEEGYYIIIVAKGIYHAGTTHYSPIVGWDKDKNKPIVWDVAGGGKTWDDWKSCGIMLGSCHLYKSTVSSAKDTILNGNTTKSDVDEATNSEEVKEGLQNVLTEWELTGMPKESDLLGVAEEIELVGRENMTIKERENMEGIGGNIRTRDRLLNIVNISFMFIGIALSVYAIILYVCGVFDTTNEWIEVSLVERFTFGRCRVIKGLENKDVEKKLSSGDFTVTQWRIRCVVLLTVGIILISGILYKAIAFIVYKKIFHF